jgi:hypothetical protein
VRATLPIRPSGRQYAAEIGATRVRDSAVASRRLPAMSEIPPTMKIAFAAAAFS